MGTRGGVPATGGSRRTPGTPQRAPQRGNARRWAFFSSLLRNQFGRQKAGLTETHKRYQRPRHIPNDAVENALRNEEDKQQERPEQHLGLGEGQVGRLPRGEDSKKV